MGENAYKQRVHARPELLGSLTLSTAGVITVFPLAPLCQPTEMVPRLSQLTPTQYQFFWELNKKNSSLSILLWKA